MRFFPSDWRSDPALRMCSMAARGLWIEMLGVMHEAKPRGHLLVKSAPPTTQQLAIIVGCGETECADLIAELERNGVFSRKRSGVIYSRRMEADEIKSRKNRDNGRKGGNPALSLNDDKKRENRQSDNRQVIRGDKAQKPEARSQIRKEKNSISLSTSPQPFEVDPRDQDRFREFWAAYPLKQGQMKAEAEFIVATIATPADVIIAGAKLYTTSRQGEDQRFTMQPARWLAERRWTDQPAAPAEPPPKTDRYRRLAAGYGPPT